MSSATGPRKSRFPGAAYLSGALIALALLAIVLLARRRVAPATVVLPTLQPTPADVTVYVAGAVVRPDVYKLPSNSRVKDAIARAGGMRPGADELAVNLAQRVTDGMEVKVPTKGAAVHGATPAASSGPVNLNTATKEELESLPGIGPAKASAIVEYREQHGAFKAPEDVQNVPGIGPALWDEIKDRVTV